MNVLVPTKINDITLEQYQKFAKVNVEGADQEFLLHKSIELFCDVDINIVSKFPLKDAEALYKDISHVLNQEESFVTQFEHNGVKYGFIPKLEDMTLGEYIDLEDGLKEISQFHKAAAVMYRPITKSVKNFYKVEAYNPSPEKHAIAKTMPLGIITAAVVFFYRIANELLADSQDYSKKLLKEQMISLEKDSLQGNTAGSIASTHFAKVIRQNMDLLQK